MTYYDEEEVFTRLRNEIGKLQHGEKPWIKQKKE
jgi:hypothetical protein